jgi:hypothetical protein
VEIPSLRSGALAQALAATKPRPASGVYRTIIPRYGVWILLLWLITAIVTLAVEPNYDNASNAELIYYSIYNVAIGSFVGLYLTEFVSREGWPVFLLRSCAAIISGTLINETLVEPQIFGTGAINAEGVYYGLVEALTTSGIFLLLRLALHLRALQQQVHVATVAVHHCRVEEAPQEALIDGTDCFFVRVAGETRRILAADLIYMEAERDFTRVVCSNGEHFVSESLKSLLEKSALCGVVRVHKSFAVNLRRVERLTRTEAGLGDWRVPVGRKYWEAFAETWKRQPPPVASGDQHEARLQHQPS